MGKNEINAFTKHSTVYYDLIELILHEKKGRRKSCSHVGVVVIVAVSSDKKNGNEPQQTEGKCTMELYSH